MKTIRKALRNSPIAAAVTLLILGLSVGFALVGIVYPDVWRLAALTLSVVMMAMGGGYFVIKTTTPTQQDYSQHFHQSQQPNRIRLSFGIQFTTIRNGNRVDRQMMWAA